MSFLQVLLFSFFFGPILAYNLYGPPKQATLRERPFQVALLKNNVYRCSATLISAKCIATACSCVIDKTIHLSDTEKLADNYTIVTYTRYIWVEQINWEEASDVFIAQGCNTKTNENDVAIICSKEKLVGFPAKLVKERTKENVRGIVSGWGLSVLGEEDVHSDLRRAYMRIISLEECRERYPGVREVPDSALCAVATDEVRGFCDGDIGGPLTHGEGLIGISVASFGCGDVKYPGIFTNVSRISDFIDNVVKDFETEVEFD